MQHRAMNDAGEQPQIHSNADPLTDGRLSAPSASRNAAPILAALRKHAPATGLALEIAAGTGQHAVAFSQAFPGLRWQPTDIAPDRLASIEAWRQAEGPDNLLPPIALDVARGDWQAGPADLIVLVNLMHLISQADARNALQGIGRSLAPGGVFFLYGPFRTDGRFRSDGDADFDARLRAADPETGYKDLDWIEAEAVSAGLSRRALIEMPANNLALVLAKA